VTQLAQKNQPKSDCGDPCEEIAKLRELIEQQRAEYSKHEFAAEGKVAIPKPVFIFFELNSTNIAKDFEQDLEFVANFLKANPSFAITLTGHADKRGNRKINEQISAKRANACKDFIVKKGIEPRRITMSSYGADREINEKIFIDEAQNRRVEIHFNKLDVN
jgi:outer membrane protein OmpA-like peptidoglycan-associated protein